MGVEPETIPEPGAGRERRPVFLVSACLCGMSCRFDGGHNLCPDVVAQRGRVYLVPVCPEQLGGLPTPRPAAEIVGGTGEDVLRGRARVLTRPDSSRSSAPCAPSTPCASGEMKGVGHDVTAAFVLGARQVVAVARLVGAVGAILKARSPSCGVGAIYDGSFSGVTRQGSGVAAAALAAEGVLLLSEDDLPGVDLGR